MSRLLVLQSLWSMVGLGSAGTEFPLERKLKMILDAGFDGAGVQFIDRAYVADATAFLRENGKIWQAQAYPGTIGSLEPVLEMVRDFGADHINVQADVRPLELADAVPLVEGWLRLADEAGVRLHFETHRNRLTGDLPLTLQLLDRFPTFKLTGDLSHYVVGREMNLPITAENEQLMRRILDRSEGFHGRIASAEQIQIQLDFPAHKAWTDQFLAWWEYGFAQWRARAPHDGALTFLCEFGPPPYAMTDADGREASDRWAEALAMKNMVQRIWAGLEAQTRTSAC